MNAHNLTATCLSEQVFCGTEELRPSPHRPGFAMRSAPAAAAHGKTGALCHGFAMSARRSLPPFLFRDGVHCETLEEYFEEFVTVLLCGECVLNPSVLEGAIFHNRPILRPQIRCVWNKSFLSFAHIFWRTFCCLQFSSTDTVYFISRGSDIPQSAWKTQKVVWCIYLLKQWKANQIWMIESWVWININHETPHTIEMFVNKHHS